MKLSKTQKAVLALIVANIIWGAAAPIFKWSLANVQPFTLAFLRFFVAAYIILLFTMNNLGVKKKDFIYIIIASFFGITVNIAFFFIGLQYTASINSPVIGSSGPVFLLLCSVLFLHERAKRKMVIGMLLGLLGVIIIILRPILEGGLDTSLLGNILILIATFASVIYTIILKKISAAYNFLTITFWTFIIGSLTFFPLMLWEIQTKGFLTHLNIQGATGIIYGIFFSSAIAYALYGFAIKNMLASETGVFTYIDPVIAVLIAVPLLGEKVTFAYLLGSTLVLIGIFVAEGRIQYHPLQKLAQGLKEII